MSTPDISIVPVAPERRSWLSRDLLVKILAGVVIVAVWEICVRLWGPNFVARPSRIATVFPDVIASRAFWEAAALTLSSCANGLVIAVAAGTAIGIAIGRVRVIERLLQIYVNGLFAMPMVAILPLLTLWFGYTGDARLATVVFASIFAIIVNVSDGARAVPTEYMEVSRSFRGSGWSRLFDVILPSSVPYLLAGLRLAAGRAPIGRDFIDEFLEVRRWRRKLPGLVVQVFMENERAARLQRVHELLQRFFRPRQKREDPARPSRIGAADRNGIGDNVDLMGLHLREAARLCLRFQRVEKPSRALQRVHLPIRTDHLRKVHRRKARPRAEIDHLAAIADARARPCIERARAPNPVLKAQAIDFIVVRAEHVVAFSHETSPCREI